MSTITVIGTLDSKGHEHAFVAERIRAAGQMPLLEINDAEFFEACVRTLLELMRRP